MSGVDVGEKIERAWIDSSSPIWSPPTVLSSIFALTVLTHGPIDVGLTALAWHFETNPVVLKLGLWPWLAVKIFALSAAGFVWLDAPRYNPRPYVREAIAGMGVTAGFGLGLVYLNVALLAGVFL